MEDVKVALVAIVVVCGFVLITRAWRGAVGRGEIKKARMFIDASRLELKPDDIVVIRIDGFISDQLAKRIKNMIKEVVPNHEVLVLQAGMELGVLSKAKEL